MAGQPLAVVEDLDFDVADHLISKKSREASPVQPYGPPYRQARNRRVRRAAQVLDVSQVHQLRVSLMPEPGPLIERADVRPLLGHAIDAWHRQVAVRVLTSDSPLLKLADAGGNEFLRGLARISPAGVADPRTLWPEQQPADLACVPVGLADALVGRVSQQVRGRGNALPLLGDQRHSLAHPRVDYELAWL